MATTSPGPAMVVFTPLTYIGFNGFALIYLILCWVKMVQNVAFVGICGKKISAATCVLNNIQLRRSSLSLLWEASQNHRLFRGLLPGLARSTVPWRKSDHFLSEVEGPYPRFFKLKVTNRTMENQHF